VASRQKSLARHSSSDLHGVETPAARHRLPSQYWALAHWSLERHESPTAGVPQVPGVPRPPSSLVTRPRQRSSSDWHCCVELQGWPVWAVVVNLRQVLSSVSHES
jgi:hypothetical protein